MDTNGSPVVRRVQRLVRSFKTWGLTKYGNPVSYQFKLECGHVAHVTNGPRARGIVACLESNTPRTLGCVPCGQPDMNDVQR